LLAAQRRHTIGDHPQGEALAYISSRIQGKVREGVRIFDDEPVALAAQTVVLVLAGLPQVR